MKAYTANKLRNICFLSHGGAGKTTLTEAMLFSSGAVKRMGKVPEGNTVSDYDQEETKRNISISTSIAPCEWKDHKINVIDTPGYFDFVGEVMEGTRVSDGAVILVSAKGGIQVGTEKSWDYADKENIPRMFYISKMDEENADFDTTLQQLKDSFGNGVVAFQLPIIENDKFIGFVDVLNMTAKKFENDSMVDIEIPDSLTDSVNEIKEALNEAIAENDEELMEKFFEGEEFTPEEVKKGLSLGLSDGSLVPVFCGSAFNNQGVESLMDAIINLMPSPVEKDMIEAKKAGSEDVVELKVSPDESLSALVFKTIADPFVGRISLFRVYSGTMKSDTTVYNSTAEKNEKVSQLFCLKGKEKINTEKVITGDIGAIAKLQATSTNDTLCEQKNPVELKKIEFPEPAISMAVEPKTKGDEEKISSGLQKIRDEDPTFDVYTNKETKQTLISGVGEQHLDVIISKLKSKFNVSVDLKNPTVPYRETIRKKVKVEGKHKKQSGGHGQYGHVFIEFEPGNEEDLEFEEKIYGGAVPRQYFAAVEKGLRESIQYGVLAGYPVVNLKAVLVDGSYHPVDSSEMAFKVAASLAYKKGMTEAGPVLLEPIVHVEVYVPDNYMGDIIGDLNKRRGKILGMNPHKGGIQQVVAEVPQAEMFKYATDLRSITQGRGYFKLWFERYEETPSNIAEKVIEAANKEEE